MKIFVSATSSDLRSYRHAVADYLRRLRFQVEVQEEFQTDYRTIRALLTEKIKSCDAVICLIGRVFGLAPAAQTDNPPRSYTQLEFYIAAELQKPTFIFFGAEKCLLDGSGTDTPEQAAWQRLYSETIARREEIRYEFASHNHLLVMVGDAARNMEQQLGLTDFARTVRQHFPTPLAMMYAHGLDADEDALTTLAIQSLRFVALLSAQDAILHDAFACDSAERLDQLQLLRRRMKTADWRLLLRLACPDNSPYTPRFLPHFAGWEQRHTRCFDFLLDAIEVLGAGRHEAEMSELEDARTIIRNGVADLYHSLDFLQQFLFVAVTKTDVSARRMTVDVFRGQQIRSVELAIEQHCESLPFVGAVYLLHLDRRQAMPLTPAFWHQPGPSQDDLWGCRQLTLTEGSGQVVIAPFSRQNSKTLTLVPPGTESGDSNCLDRIPHRWLTCGLWDGKHLPRSVDRRSTDVRQLLAVESWEVLQRTVLPADEAERLVGGAFRLVGQSLHHGRHADVYEAVREDRLDATRHAVHLLREESSKDPTIRAWFGRRQDLWRMLNHPQVLPLDTASSGGADSPRPFLASELIAGGRTLEYELLMGRKLTGPEVIQIVTLAAEVCLEAHRCNLRVLALPLRHFLIDENGRYWLTGFETLMQSDAKVGSTLSIKYFQSCSKDWDQIAPEVNRSLNGLAQTVDVYALGVLLCRLRGISPCAIDWLPIDLWNDPWQCLAFHCLAITPTLRLQSVDQFVRLLTELVSARSTLHGPVREALNGKRDLRFGQYLVTNSQYVQYCREKDRPMPPHLSDIHREDCPYRRLAGPWCPVVFVHLKDAEAYANWLSHRTDERWRVPTESEWLFAAGAQDHHVYPWGAERPHPELANYDRFFRGPTPVGAFTRGASPTGCFDLAGNVWEWCTDVVDDGAPKRVLKGGAYGFAAEALQISARRLAIAYYRSPHVGLRLLCEGAIG